jgi:hypothetical protein
MLYWKKFGKFKHRNAYKIQSIPFHYKDPKWFYEYAIQSEEDDKQGKMTSIDYRQKKLIDLEDKRNVYTELERKFFEECMKKYEIETIYIGKQRKKKKKREKFIIYNQKKIFNLKNIKKNNKLSEVSESCTDSVILPLISNNCCAKNELDGMIVNYEAPNFIRFDTKEKWRTKFRIRNDFDEQLPNDNLMEQELKERLEMIRDVSQQGTNDVILPLISDNCSAKK